MPININKFLKVEYEASKNVAISIWTEETEEMDEDDFKSTLRAWKAYLVEKNAKNAISDALKFRFAITPELQLWVMENITVPLSKETDYSKHAFIMPQSFISNLSVEQYIDETKNAEKIAESRYFASMTEARNWLFK